MKEKKKLRPGELSKERQELHALIQKSNEDARKRLNELSKRQLSPKELKDLAQKHFDYE